MADNTKIEASKERLHQLINELPEGAVQDAERALRSLGEGHSLLKALESAPEDDEPVTEEERQAIEEGIEAARSGDLHRLDDVKRELSL